MQVIWEYDGPEWRKLKAVREAMREMGPKGEALAVALHSVMQGDLDEADAYIRAAKLGTDDDAELAMADIEGR